MEFCVDIAVKLLAVVEKGVIMSVEVRWGGIHGCWGSSRLRWWAGGARRSLGMVLNLR